VLTGLAGPQGLALGTSGKIFIANATDILSFQPQSVNFGTQAVAATSGTSTNTVALPFSISAGQTVGAVSILTTGATGKDFTDAGSSTCTAQTYTSASTCMVNVNFTPLAPGLRQGAVVIADGNNVPLVTVPLYGTGTGPLPVFAAHPPEAHATNVFSSPALAVDAAGNIYATAQESSINAHGLVKIAPDGSQTVLSPDQIGAVAIDGAGNIYYGDQNTGNFTELFPNGTSTTLSYLDPNAVQALVFDGTGNAYYATPSQVFYTTPAGAQTAVFTVPNSGNITGIALDASGNLYVADNTNNAVYKSTPQGVVTTVVSGLDGVDGVAVDPSGNLYVTEFDNGKVDEVSPTGTVTQLTNFGNAPWAVVLDQFGNVYYSDWFTNSIYTILRGYNPAFLFANTPQGSESTDSPQTATVTNIGNTPLTFSAISYPADFPEDSSGSATDCTISTSLAPNADCTFTIDFKPVQSVTSNTLLVEAVTATTNYLTSPYQYVNVAGFETYSIPTAATPFFSVNGGALNNPQPVTISDTTPGAVIYYTVNGTTPTTSSPIYSGPISLPYGFTLQAIATASGYSQSSVQSATYTLAAATPTASVASGTYTSAQTVVLSTASTAAIIFYTTNGLPPTTSSAHYTGPITVGASETLKFFAIATGYTASPVVTAQYTISPSPDATTSSSAGGTDSNAHPTSQYGDSSAGGQPKFPYFPTQP